HGRDARATVTHMTQSTGGNRERIAALMKQLQTPGLDQAKRDQTLDELQDLVGLAGKMVMEQDIVRRAKKIVEGNA
ncbi:MAG TPA: hypothetical protein VLI90_06915, partial [Tepidisphaeraceae bacterium]|nr:hypothetical protein [Tepidisphaeraceae bacterium]